MQVVKETDNLFRLTRFGIVNCFLVREDDGLTLVDANLPGSANSILHSADEIGLPIRRILLTHAHFDHVGAVDELMRATKGLELLIGSREARLLAGDMSLEANETGRNLFGFMRTSAQPTRLLREGEQIGSLSRDSLARPHARTYGFSRYARQFAPRRRCLYYTTVAARGGSF